MFNQGFCFSYKIGPIGSQTTSLLIGGWESLNWVTPSIGGVYRSSFRRRGTHGHNLKSPPYFWGKLRRDRNTDETGCRIRPRSGLRILWTVRDENVSGPCVGGTKFFQDIFQGLRTLVYSLPLVYLTLVNFLTPVYLSLTRVPSLAFGLTRIHSDHLEESFGRLSTLQQLTIRKFDDVEPTGK